MEEDQPDPDYLYKYRSLASELDVKRVVEILTRHKLWFSAPSTFNDPFDCFPCIKTTFNTSDLLGIAQRTADRRTMGQPKHIREQARAEYADRILNKPIDTPQIQAMAVQFMKEVVEDVGVLSLSTEPKNVLMWSHYGHCHTGICLRFRVDRDSLFQEAQPVIYHEQRPIVDLIGDRENAMVRTLLHKADYWKYENEWRIFRTGKVGAHGYRPESLDGIIFGARTVPEHERIIREASAKDGVSREMKRAEFDSDDFRLNFVAA